MNAKNVNQKGTLVFRPKGNTCFQTNIRLTSSCQQTYHCSWNQTTVVVFYRWNCYNGGLWIAIMGYNTKYVINSLIFFFSFSCCWQFWPIIVFERPILMILLSLDHPLLFQMIIYTGEDRWCVTATTKTNQWWAKHNWPIDTFSLTRLKNDCDVSA